jgi:methionyl-tRNA synthetase
MTSFYVTTPIYYANSLPHLGHLYTTIVADCVARYKRQRGFATYFLTGTDEHGINIERAAERNNRTPKEQVDYVVGELKKMLAEFSLDTAHGGYDIFMRTTESFHCEGVSELWRQCAQAKTPKGREAIYKGHYEGWFCAACAAYKTEDEYVKAATPGDAPLCPIHETSLDRISEESYFFRLSDYGEALLELYETRPDFVRPESRRNEVMSFVRGGLQDLSISRLKTSVSWGIPVPDDTSHTMFVWFDALSNYITAIGFGNEVREHAVGFEKYWPAVHLIGKDILRQHAIYWPAMLMAGGIEMPRCVIAHGMWLDPLGRKMSKTIGNTVDLDVLHKYFQPDAVRYFCLREMMFGQDSKVGYESVIERANGDLASGLGNLSSRTLTMIHRYREGIVPSPHMGEGNYLASKRAGIDPDPMALVSALEHARDQFIAFMDDYAFSRALESAWAILSRVDKMISDAKPWELAKHEEQAEILNAILYRSAECIRWLCVLLFPIMPVASREMFVQLGLFDDPGDIDPTKLSWGGLLEGTRITEVKALFPRLDKKKIMGEIESNDKPGEHSGTHATEADAVSGVKSVSELQTNAPAQHATEADAAAAVTKSVDGVQFIEIGDFAKIDLRVGQVLTAERIPKSDKLLRFTVDLGEAEPRQILAGIAEFYEPETLVGRKLVIVANLKPRKLRGFESQGMVLAASVGQEGKPVLATFAEDVPNGARLK